MKASVLSGRLDQASSLLKCKILNLKVDKPLSQIVLAVTESDGAMRMILVATALSVSVVVSSIALTGISTV